MRAGTITLRVGERLVAVGCDTSATYGVCRERFADWLDESQPDIEVAFDLRLDEVGRKTATRGAPRPVPQLRLGSTAVARSRSADEVMAAFDSMLGGVLASQDETRTWLWLRPFVTAERMVLVDATAPMLVNDPGLARTGISELPTWMVALDVAPGGGVVVDVPAPLTRTTNARRFDLVGLVGVTPDPPTTDGELLSRYGARHTAVEWFRTANALAGEQRLIAAPDAVAARRAIVGLLR